MKIGRYTAQNGVIEGIKILRPIQEIGLLIKFKQGFNTPFDYLSNSFKVNASIVNSKSGAQDTVIPYCNSTDLALVRQFHQGHILAMGQDNLLLPVLLNPVGSIQLDNDKYVQLDFSNIPNVIDFIEIYIFDEGKITDFVAKYSKMAAPAGVARHLVKTDTSELLVIPTNFGDSLQVTYKNGSVVDYTTTDLQFYMARNNDVSFIQQRNFDGINGIGGLLDDGEGARDVTVGYVGATYNRFLFDLADVRQIEIIRDSNSANACEFLLCDFVKN